MQRLKERRNSWSTPVHILSLPIKALRDAHHKRSCKARLRKIFRLRKLSTRNVRKNICLTICGVVLLCAIAGVYFKTYDTLIQIFDGNQDEVYSKSGSNSLEQENTIEKQTSRANHAVKKSFFQKKTRQPIEHTSRRSQGYTHPKKKSSLPGLTILTKTYTKAELLDKHSRMDIIYTFVNGSELNHGYRKSINKKCGPVIQATENEWLKMMMSAHGHAENESVFSSRTDASKLSEEPIVSNFTWSHPPTETHSLLTKCNSDIIVRHTVQSLLEKVANLCKRTADNRDRDLDELRFSFRSLEQHVHWHRGRVIIVSPGHHPTWINPAKNFLTGQCGELAATDLRESGKHSRITTVHQDSILPHGARLTANSYVIEQHLWRVKNISPVHLYFNDDYFVNSDVDITDVLNEYGGTMVRTEEGIINRAEKPQSKHSWADGVAHTNLFNIVEIDINAEDHLPAEMIDIWQKRASSENADSNTLNAPHISVPTPALESTISTSMRHAAPKLPERITVGDLSKLAGTTSRWKMHREMRRFAAHAPFAYCTNMLRFLSTRYELEFGWSALTHRSRSSSDLLMPFVYNAFIEARPWVASPNFLPYLVALRRYRDRKSPNDSQTDLATSKATITLNNDDGCAPATVLIGRETSRHIFAKVSDNPHTNENFEKYIKAKNPLFFNLNAGCSSDNCTKFQTKLLSTLFPNTSYLESEGGSVELNPHAPNEESEADPYGSLNSLFHNLMQLPIVLVTMFAENTCPLLRSLQLALREHRGRVKCVVMQQSSLESNDAALQKARDELLDGLHSAMPVTDCVLGSNVQTQERNLHRDAPTSNDHSEKDDTPGAYYADDDIADIARSALSEHEPAEQANADRVVTMPRSCGSAYDGLRVHGFVIDSRTSHDVSVVLHSREKLRTALGMPGQTLALEDFRITSIGPGHNDVVLVLARTDADLRAVHWITAATKNDLLLTYPLPYSLYENKNALVSFH